MGELRLDRLGALAGPTTISFGVLLPWVTPDNGQSVFVKVIHEHDQFLHDVPAVEVPLDHTVDPEHGDYWSITLDLTVIPGPAGSRWGRPGRYVYRYVVDDPRVGRVDWVIDPYAREFGTGKQSAVTLGGTPQHVWSTHEADWQVPDQADLVLYEMNVAEFGGDFTGAAERLDYLADLGVTCLSLMPITNVAVEVDWGYLPVGYFGVDERFGGPAAFGRFVDEAHQRGVAVVVDGVYGHVSRALFGYAHLYRALRYDQNPFLGPFAADMFDDFGASVDYRRPLVGDFYAAVTRFWLERFHVDGFRYDCVPNYWDGPTGVGYAALAYRTWQRIAAGVAAGDPDYVRFSGTSVIACAEHLDDARGVLTRSYSTSAWQDETLHAATACAHGEPGALDRFAAALGLPWFPEVADRDGVDRPVTALQYLESHDHSRFLAAFGVEQTDETGNPLFLVADRDRWYKVQPYLIALLAAKGIPMLWQGQELGEVATLPSHGQGRIGLLRPVTWDYFYDDAGRTLVTLVRRMIQVRRRRPQLRRGSFAADLGFTGQGVLVFRREFEGATTVVAINVTDVEQRLALRFPARGRWVEELGGGDVVVGDAPVGLTLPSNYGRVWTRTDG